MPSSIEILDIINENDEVVGSASRADIYANYHPHRIVHILFQSANGDIALQKRGKNQSFMPGAWGTTVGGHVSAGESYEAAARRECEEEVGAVVQDLTPVGRDWYTLHYEGKPLHKLIQVFVTEWSGALTPTSDEGDEVRFVSPHEILQMQARGETLMPELEFILSHILHVA